MKVSTLFLNMVVEPAVRKFCGPLFFTTSSKVPKGNVHASGTYGLVTTGKKKLMVTCFHVWQEFLTKRSEDPNLRFAVCTPNTNPISFEIDSCFVDGDRTCDLVTFDVTELDPISRNPKLDFYNLYANPPPKIQIGDVLYLIGFPGKGRIEDATSIGFPRQPFGIQASQIGEFKFFADVTNLKLGPDDYGGISGSPCFVVDESRPARLVGFTIGYAPNAMNLLQFTYTKFSDSEGIIRHVL